MTLPGPEIVQPVLLVLGLSKDRRAQPSLA